MTIKFETSMTEQKFCHMLLDFMFTPGNQFEIIILN